MGGAFCVNSNRDAKPRLGVPGSAKATVSLGVSQRSRSRGLRGAHIPVRCRTRADTSAGILSHEIFLCH